MTAKDFLDSASGVSAETERLPTFLLRSVTTETAKTKEFQSFRDTKRRIESDLDQGHP
jgi:hypothetical protein